jgi:hypothetical protein
MTPARWCAAVALAGIAVAVLLPLSPALASGDVRQARLLGAVLTVGICTAFGLLKGGPYAGSTVTAIVAALGGVGLLLAHVNANATCVAQYAGGAVLIGRDLTASGAEYVRLHPGSSPSDLLLDVAGAADRIWTPASIASCRFWMGWGGLLAVPLLAAAVCALVVRRSFRFAPAARPRTAGQSRSAPGPDVYDAFVSYRHTEPDKTHAQTIVEALESRGLRVAIDFRDFAPNQHFLFEMERCIKESRFVLCVVTPQYLDSVNCSEEAVISKVLDMAERRKRLVPLIFERVELPVWLYGLVGIDFTASAPVDPLERLRDLVTARAGSQPG